MEVLVGGTPIGEKGGPGDLGKSVCTSASFPILMGQEGPTCSLVGKGRKTISEFVKASFWKQSSIWVSSVPQLRHSGEQWDGGGEAPF